MTAVRRRFRPAALMAAALLAIAIGARPSAAAEPSAKSPADPAAGVSSPDPAVRKAAYARLAKLDDNERLRLSAVFPGLQEKRLAAAAKALAVLDTRLGAFARAHQPWNEARRETLKISAKGKEADLKELDAAYKRTAEAFPAMAEAVAPAAAALSALQAEIDWLNEIELQWARNDPTHDKGRWDLPAVLNRTGRTHPDDDAMTDAERVGYLLREARRVAAANAAVKFLRPDEAAMLAETNTRRLNLGLVPVVAHEKLTTAARGHSADMARLKFFAHESPVKGKTTPADRAKLAGYFGEVGENISFNYPGAAAAVLGWWHSAPHRLNMLGGWSEIGLGTDKAYRTMLLGNPGM